MSRTAQQNAVVASKPSAELTHFNGRRLRTVPNSQRNLAIDSTISSRTKFPSSMPNRTSAQINAEIYNIGPTFFEAVRNTVRAKGTEASSPAQHNANKRKLDAAVASVLAQALPNDIDHRGLWQALWPRVVYAGTLSTKATAEIVSMRALIPLFQDLDSYIPGQYEFDKAEWEAFVSHWKGRQVTAPRKLTWLRLSKADRDWNPAAHFAKAKTAPEVWKILTKDDATYPGLKFSAKADKMQKYLSVAKFLHEHRAGGNLRPLDHYTGGHEFSPKHLTGQEWLQERKTLEAVRERLGRQVGKLTALHSMMDLGLKTIKPDRVMTYLFSQLGWLQTLPDVLDKKAVLDAYLASDVVQEMTSRADVLAASLDRAGFSQAHRLLDIWLVKFGQEPEPDFGVTVNLQDRGPGIRSILDGLNAGPSIAALVTAQDSAAMWPLGEFVQVRLANGPATPRQAAPVRRMRLPRQEVERLFTEQWRRGFEARPDIYPAGRPGIDNVDKAEILRKIECGVHPEEAFLSVLISEEDD